MYNLKFIAIYNIATHFLNIHCLKTMIIARDTRAVFCIYYTYASLFNDFIVILQLNVVLNYT